MHYLESTAKSSTNGKKGKFTLVTVDRSALTAAKEVAIETTHYYHAPEKKWLFVPWEEVVYNYADTSTR